jgi:hypothetical protein
MPQRKYFVATGIIVFDFELFIGGVVQKQRATSGCPQPFYLKLPFLMD